VATTGTTQTADPIRLLILDADDDTPALLKSLLRGRIERPFTIEVRADVPAAHTYDVLLLEVHVTPQVVEHDLVTRVRRVLAASGAPPLVLLNGTRSRSLEGTLLNAGAVDFIWKEELSAPLLESQVRHALGAREHALLERQFHESQKLETVGRLAGGVAHDFNNILTSIVGFGSLVAEQVKGDEEAEANVAEILQAADRASVLTRQLLAFGRRQVMHPVRLQMDETVQGVSSLITRLLGEDIDLKVSCQPGLPPVRGDRAQLESALLNLVMNAREAMPRGGQLTIETAETILDERYCATNLEVLPGRYVRLAVSDTGDGLPQHAQERIFEPFYSTTHRPRGNGLGLAAVYGIVKQSGGHILVYSEAGAGTTFRIYLPVDESPQAPVEPPAAAKEAPRGAGTVLLVEDADAIRRLASEVIRRAGYRVLEACDPEQAMAVAGAYEGEIHLLLTDIMMPNGNGVDLAGRMLDRRPQLSVLFMSGYTDDAVIRNGMLASEAAFIQKPFTPYELLRRVKQILEVGV
jgi:two-component system, cell cycle sensor histidine kinase and response regulator CckA